MSRADPTDGEFGALAHACPSCRAPRWTWCATDEGRYLHGLRIVAAAAARETATRPTGPVPHVDRPDEHT